MDWAMIAAAIITMLVCGIGAIMWMWVPPAEPDWKKIVPKWLCAMVIGLFLFLSGMDPRAYSVPSTQIGIWFISLIALGYSSIEVLKKLLEQHSTPPTPP